MHFRSLIGAAVVLASLGLGATTAHAQGGVGIGLRMAFVQSETEESDGSDRYIGGVLRLGSGKMVIELAIDYRSDELDNLLVRVKDTPIQGSLLFYPVKSSLAPYLLGGVGWYSQTIERLDTAADTPVDDVTNRRFGYHAGLGGDLLLTRHISLFGDYRYTLLHFGDDDDEDSTPGLIPFAGRLGLSHEGSMFTWGAVFHF